MPSSLSGGPAFRFLNIHRKLTLKGKATLVMEPQATIPNGSGVKGQIYMNVDGKLYIHNGTAFVAAGAA